ncbi:MAG: hypothetical protein ACRDVE_10155 [Actinocrinis sp.]
MKFVLWALMLIVAYGGLCWLAVWAYRRVRDLLSRAVARHRARAAWRRAWAQFAADHEFEFADADGSAR